MVELPSHLQDATLLTACEGEDLICFARRNHIHVGSKLVLEKGWIRSNPTRLGKTVPELLEEIHSEQVAPEIRHYVQITRKGGREVAKLSLVTRQLLPVAKVPVSDAVVPPPVELITIDKCDLRAALGKVYNKGKVLSESTYRNWRDEGRIPLHGPHGTRAKKVTLNLYEYAESARDAIRERCRVDS